MATKEIFFDSCAACPYLEHGVQINATTKKSEPRFDCPQTAENVTTNVQAGTIHSNCPLEDET